MNLDVSHVFHNIWQTFVVENTDERLIKVEGKYKLSNEKATLLIQEGSARSTKTHSILQFLDTISLFKQTGLKITLGRDTLKNCKDTIIVDFLEILNSVNREYSFNKSESVITIDGNFYKFIGLDDPHKGHGAQQDILYVNEIMGVKEESFRQRMIRTSLFTIVDYNPSEDKHYIYEYKKRDSSIFYKSSLFQEVRGKYKFYKGMEVIDYDEETDTSIVLQHPFAPRNQVNELYLSRPCKKHDEQGTSSEWHWQVYGLGNKCAKEGLIFNNWSITEDYDTVVSEEEKRYGLDFGFVHPTAMVEVKRVGRSLYVKQLIYKSGLTPPLLNSELDTLKSDETLNEWDYIKADASRADLITDIYNAGYNIHSCKKTKDFKINKINQLQGYKIYIDHNSPDFKDEISSWMWRKDRYGNQLPEPVKIKDDLMDAFIYACEGMFDEEKVVEYKVMKV